MSRMEALDIDIRWPAGLYRSRGCQIDRQSLIGVAPMEIAIIRKKRLAFPAHR
ncbi:MAG: hypothetical protein ABW168_27835 [Sedimenticola sp.]